MYDTVSQSLKDRLHENQIHMAYYLAVADDYWDIAADFRQARETGNPRTPYRMYLMLAAVREMTRGE